MAEQQSGDSFSQFIEGVSIDQLLCLARLTEAAERYENMCEIMGKIVTLKKAKGEDLEVEERNMLSVAYKNVVGARRASWRTFNHEQKATEETPEDITLTLEVTAEYKRVVETELSAKCQEVLQLLKTNLLVDEKGRQKMKDEILADKNLSTETLETQVFYLKMSGDYYRYLAEFDTDQAHKTAAEASYQAAISLAEVLPATHPTRLGLALNASVCYWEILNSKEKACELAKRAFDEAIQKLDSLSDSTYKDSTLIMQLLRDNLTIWTAENEAATEEREAEA